MPSPTIHLIYTCIIVNVVVTHFTHPIYVYIYIIRSIQYTRRGIPNNSRSGSRTPRRPVSSIYYAIDFRIFINFHLFSQICTSEVYTGYLYNVLYIKPMYACSWVNKIINPIMQRIALNDEFTTIRVPTIEIHKRTVKTHTGIIIFIIIT